jgi:uncharacterized membrane protein
MNSRFVGILLLIITIACFVTGAIVYPALPALLVSHWGVNGEPDGVMGKFWGVALIPLIMLACIGLWALLPRIDPIAKGFVGFRRVYDFLMFLIIAFLAYIYALMLGINLGWNINMSVAILTALGVLIVAIGLLLPYVKRNWFVGIRTPWTISSDAVWDKTHHVGSILFKAAGLVIFLGAFLDPAYALVFVVIPLLTAVLVPVVYSYFLYRRETVQ